MQYFWEALNNFTNGQWRWQRTAWVQTPLLGYRDGGGGRVSSTSTWALISFSSSEDRSRFLRFVTGRSRLPARIYIYPDKLG